MGSELEFDARRGGVGEREAREHVEPELQLAALGVAEFAGEQLLHAALFGGKPLVSLLEQPFHRLHVHERLHAARTRTGASAGGRACRRAGDHEVGIPDRAPRPPVCQPPPERLAAAPRARSAPSLHRARGTMRTRVKLEQQ